MTTKAWTVEVLGDTVARLKTWAQSLSDALDDIGFTQSNDTGQIDIPAIVGVPLAGQSAGYQIRYLDDGLHATAPLYLKLEYGTNPNYADRPALFVTAGTGTDGAGTLSGVFLPRVSNGDNVIPSGGLKQCYACATEGAVWVSFGEYYTSSFSQGMGFALFRTTDPATGAPTAEGAACYAMSGLYPRVATRSLRSSWVFAPVDTPPGFGGGGRFAAMANGATSLALGNGDKQAMPHILPFPELRIVRQICSTHPGDGLATGTEFDAALVGVSPARYKVVHGLAHSGQDRMALIWE